MAIPTVMKQPTITTRRPGDDELPPFRGDGNGRWPDEEGDKEFFPLHRAKFGMWLFLAAVVMLFAGFSSAYIIHRLSAGWQSAPLPGILWFNTGILLLSSFTLFKAGHAARQDKISRLKGYMGLTLGLGLLFLGGQLIAWKQLIARGYALSDAIQAAFFYVLTGTHGLHLLGGVIALMVITARSWRGRYSASHHAPLNLFATYWHFLDALWVYLFLVLLLT